MDKVVKDFYENMNRNLSSYNKNFFCEKIQKFKLHIDTSKNHILYEVSNVFKKFVQNMDIKNLDNINLIKNLLSKYTKEPYILNLIKPCFLSSIRFKRILERHDIYDPYLIKEFMISFYIIILYMPLGKIENLKLFESIQMLWMLVDNIIDNGDTKNKKKFLKPIFKFIMNRNYEGDVKKYLEKYKNDLCMSIVNDIYDNKELTDKKAFFEDVRTLLLYSYSKKGISTEHSARTIDILHVSMKKSYLSHRLFKYCIPKDVDENEDFYYLCLVSQLSDDLMDLTEDIVNNGNTIFTNSNRRERSIITLYVLEIIIEKFPDIKNYLILTILDAVLYNKHLHDPLFIKCIENYKFINLRLFDFQEIENIIFKCKLDSILDENLVKLYDFKVINLEDNVIRYKIEAIANCQFTEV